MGGEALSLPSFSCASFEAKIQSQRKFKSR
jgi:hypothetical protein